MGVEEINRLADQYTVSNGLINYLYFFRSYLNDMVGGINSNSTRPKPSKEELNNTNNAVTKDSLKLRPLHPWEFDYKREKHPDHPYWFNASQPKPELDSRLGLSLSLPNIPPPNEKGAKDLTAAEREQLLSRYDEKILSICSKSYKQFVPIWRALRNEFKKQQITSQRGTILTTNFISIFEKNGISLDKSELGTIVRVFRGTGTQDVVKYDEFLRVCLLVKDLKN